MTLLLPIRWCLFLVSLVLYWLHSAIIFVTKPGSRVLVFFALSVSLFVARDLLHPYLEPWVVWLSSEIGYDLLAIPFFLDVALHAALVPLWLIYGLLAAVLKPIVGALPTPSFPLQPRIAPRSQKQKLKILSARITMKRAGRPKRKAMKRAYKALPAELRQIITNPSVETDS